MITIIMLIIYTAIALLLSKKNPLFLLIVPFAILQGRGAFINPSFFILGGFFYMRDLIIFLYFIIAVIISKQRLKIKYAGHTFFIIFSYYCVLLILPSFFNTNILWRVLTIFRIFIYIPISYFLLIKIFAAVEKQKFHQFMKVFIIINIISSILYILNSLKIVSIFSTVVFETINFQGETFIRDYNTRPLLHNMMFILSLVLIASGKKHLQSKKKYINFRLKHLRKYNLTKIQILKILKREFQSVFFINQFWVIINLCITLLVLIFSFTRGVILALFVSLILFIILYLTNIKKKLLNRIVVSASVIITFALLFFIANKIFSAQIDYFISRNEAINIDAVVKSKNINKSYDGNILLRFEMFSTVMTEIENSTVQLLFGKGYIQEGMKKMENKYSAFAGDNMWPFIIFFTGFIGFLIIFVIFIKFIIDAGIAYYRTNNFWYQFVFLSIVFYLILSIREGVLLENYGIPLIPFVIFTIEKNKLWKNNDKYNT